MLLDSDCREQRVCTYSNIMNYDGEHDQSEMLSVESRQTVTYSDPSSGRFPPPPLVLSGQRGRWRVPASVSVSAQDESVLPVSAPPDRLHHQLQAQHLHCVPADRPQQVSLCLFKEGKGIAAQCGSRGSYFPIYSNLGNNKTNSANDKLFRLLVL